MNNEKEEKEMEDLRGENKGGEDEGSVKSS